MVKREKSRRKSLKKWLKVSRRRQGRTTRPRRLHNDQLGEVPCEVGIAHIKMKKRRLVGEKRTKWQHSGFKGKNWKIFWNEEGWKDAPGSWRSCRRHRSYRCMNACHKAKERRVIKRRRKEKPNIAVDEDTEEKRELERFKPL